MPRPMRRSPPSAVRSRDILPQMNPGPVSAGAGRGIFTKPDRHEVVQPNERLRARTAHRFEQAAMLQEVLAVLEQLRREVRVPQNQRSTVPLR